MKTFNQIYTYIHLKIGDEKRTPSFVTQHISTHCHQRKKASIIGYKRAYDISFILSDWGRRLGEGSDFLGVHGYLSIYTCTRSCLCDSRMQLPRSDHQIFWGISRVRHYRHGNSQTGTNQAICIYRTDSFWRQLWKPARNWWAYLRIGRNLNFSVKEGKRVLLKASFNNVFTLRYWFKKVWQNIA